MVRHSSFNNPPLYTIHYTTSCPFQCYVKELYISVARFLIMHCFLLRPKNTFLLEGSAIPSHIQAACCVRSPSTIAWLRAILRHEDSVLLMFGDNLLERRYRIIPVSTILLWMTQKVPPLRQCIDGINYDKMMPYMPKKVQTRCRLDQQYTYTQPPNPTVLESRRDS